MRFQTRATCKSCQTVIDHEAPTECTHCGGDLVDASGHVRVGVYTRDPEAVPHTWWDRLDPKWSVVLMVPALYLANRAQRSHQSDHAMYALVAAGLGVVGIVLAFVVHAVVERHRLGRTRALYESDVEIVRRSAAPIHAAAANDGRARIVGRLLRVGDPADAFSTRPPKMLIEDETGLAVIDDDCLVLWGLLGALPADGTTVEVVGRGRRVSASGLGGLRLPADRLTSDLFLFDGSPDNPVHLLRAPTR